MLAKILYLRVEKISVIYAIQCFSCECPLSAADRQQLTQCVRGIMCPLVGDLTATYDPAGRVVRFYSKELARMLRNSTQYDKLSERILAVFCETYFRTFVSLGFWSLANCPTDGCFSTVTRWREVVIHRLPPPPRLCWPLLPPDVSILMILSERMVIASTPLSELMYLKFLN